MFVVIDHVKIRSTVLFRIFIFLNDAIVKEKYYNEEFFIGAEFVAIQIGVRHCNDCITSLE